MRRYGQKIELGIILVVNTWEILKNLASYYSIKSKCLYLLMAMYIFENDSDLIGGIKSSWFGFFV